MAQCVDVFARALKDIDPSAWLHFASLRDRICSSADRMLGDLEVQALRPTVRTATDAAPSSSSPPATGTSSQLSPAAPSVSSAATGPRGSAEAAAEHLLFLPRVGAEAMGVNAPAENCTITLRARLEKELRALRCTCEESRSDDEISFPVSIVFFQLSDFSQTVLAFTALWLCVKFWGTVSESCTLSGLIASFLRQQPSQQHRQQQRKESETYRASEHSEDVVNGEGSSGAVVHAECGVASAGATVPSKEAKFHAPSSALHVVGGGAFTPPPSPAHTTSTPRATAPAMWRDNADADDVGGDPMREEVRECVGCATDLELNGEGATSAAQHEGGDALVICEAEIVDGVLAHPLFPHSAVWYDDALDAVDGLARDVEEAELMLLRCSNFSIPVCD